MLSSMHSENSSSLFQVQCGNTVLLKLLAVLLIVKQVDLQMFVRDCNDPLITAHSTTFGHTYCEHACGFPSTTQTKINATSDCKPGGYCTCEGECYQNVQDVSPIVASLDVCPPLNDPPDTDPNWEAECQNTCAGECDEGIGAICGETMPFSSLSGTTDYAKVCICVCPLKQCPQPPTSNSENPNVKPSFLILYKNPYPKVLALILLSLKYFVAYSVTLALFFISLIAISLYYIFLSGSPFDIGQTINSLGIILRQVLTGILLPDAGS